MSVGVGAGIRPVPEMSEMGGGRLRQPCLYSNFKQFPNSFNLIRSSLLAVTYCKMYYQIPYSPRAK